jgi:hypothetical protein
MKLTRKQMMFGASALALVGAYLVFKSYFQKKAVAKQPTDSTKKVGGNVLATNKPIVSTPQEKFPLRKDSRDVGAPLNPKGFVVELQKLINTKGYQAPQDKFKGKPLIKLVEDGIFGTKTEQAVEFWIKKKSIDNQMDLNYLKNVLMPSTPR